MLRLQEIHLTLQKIIPKSSQFYALQRQHFLTMEKYLDAGSGSCLLRNRSAAELVVRELTGLSEWLADVPHYSIMPNHWHAILVPQPGCQHSLTEMMKRVKGRSGRSLRQMDHTQGPIWQREWFDRWLRDDSEYDKTVRYIHENPVKAGLVSRWEDHPWTH
ncbi:MAG TPA: transposase [Lacunisphaera sp.]|nr:transposase [Lacunisphaera sp.]